MALEGQVNHAAGERRHIHSEVAKTESEHDDHSARLMPLESAVEKLGKALETQNQSIQEVSARVVGVNQAFDQTRATVEKLQVLILNRGTRLWSKV